MLKIEGEGNDVNAEMAVADLMRKDWKDMVAAMYFPRLAQSL